MIESTKFDMGKIYTTKRVHATMKLDELFNADVRSALEQYANAEWGLTSKTGSALNNKAILTGERIMATYATCRGRIWISTETLRHPEEPNRITSVMFPMEYQKVRTKEREDKNMSTTMNANVNFTRNYRTSTVAELIADGKAKLAKVITYNSGNRVAIPINPNGTVKWFDDSKLLKCK